MTAFNRPRAQLVRSSVRKPGKKGMGWMKESARCITRARDVREHICEHRSRYAESRCAFPNSSTPPIVICVEIEIHVERSDKGAWENHSLYPDVKPPISFSKSLDPSKSITLQVTPSISFTGLNRCFLREGSFNEHLIRFLLFLVPVLALKDGVLLALR
ncbi:hypothetical protein CONPUDRAFT_85497 [Coniophora puteana RWD-64-598 SS2]|uniref:Uncharacterized protein n=1 Tax=Coniophora puteana (strain RWD-64-598) TaxID=741705 RepID=A0A5M3M7M4_CONPW|nr:uncharacterized protein CONPUDRAFT_85497 [Coniophora puteana RWD-64-598 SS2]EIW75229.1 hypothetical protein CONPUDRAFT_85497 [Coniophora puteana RWD-64-598 SS2]